MNPENKLYLAHTLLIELLAYQFASPVRWIETQDVILNDFEAERIIEVGPQPILKNMFTRTLNQDFDKECSNARAGRFVKCVSNDLDSIYYDQASEVKAKKSDSDEKESKTENNSDADLTTSDDVNVDIIPTNPDFSSSQHAGAKEFSAENAVSYFECLNKEVVSRDTTNVKKPNELLDVSGNHPQIHPFLQKHGVSNELPLYSHIQTLNNKIENLNSRTAKIESEFGKENVKDAIAEVFQPNRIRCYDSYWNWNRFEVYRFCMSNDNHNEIDTSRLQLLLANEATSENDFTKLNEILRFNHRTVQINDNQKFVAMVNRFKYVQQLIVAQKNNLSAGEGENFNNIDNISARLEHDMTSYYKIEAELFQVYSKIMAYASESSSEQSLVLSENAITESFQSVYEQLLVFLRNSNQINPYFRNIVDQALFSLNKANINDLVVEDISAYETEFEPSHDSACSSRSSSMFSNDDHDDDHDIMDKTHRCKELPSTNGDYKISYELPMLKGVIPSINIKSWSADSQNWNYNKNLTHEYLNNMINISDLDFMRNKKALIAVDQINNFTVQVIKSLLISGAQIFVIQSCQNVSSVSQFAKTINTIYKNNSIDTSKLFIIPVNVKSKADCEKFVRHYYYKLNTDFDFFLPLNCFGKKAALSTNFKNVQHIINKVIECKKKLGNETSPIHTLLPLNNPQCASFLQSFEVEDQSENRSFVSYMGCMLNLVEKSNGLSSEDMVVNFLSLITPRLVSFCQESTLCSELDIPSEIYSLLAQTCSSNSEKNDETFFSDKLCVEPKASNNLIKPNFESFEILQNEYNGRSLQGLLDLESVVVVTGFGEVGPYGHSKTRWEIESKGELSIEGCLEMAWLMGYIEYDKKVKVWVDMKTREPIDDSSLKEVYEKKVLEHTGVRVVDPLLFEGYNPQEKKTLLQEIILTHNLEAVEMSAELAQQYLLEHQDKVFVEKLENGQCLVTFLKGCSLMVPKALNFDRFVAGQIPTGWDPKKYGLSQDVIDQVDRVTLFALVATAEALITSGIIDPFELYQYVHVSEVGICSGSGLGGLNSQKKLQRDRMMDHDVQNDILQETFLNAMPAWINMLLLGSSGPIKTPVGACATAIESLEVGTETILSGKAQFVLVGGHDDYGEELAYEFANMGATSNSQKEVDMGRAPKEMCRPMTSTRAGFMESQGSGVQVLTSAKLAVQMGLPIYGIVGMVSLAGDKISKSLPAPGQGILTSAKQVTSKLVPKKLDLSYRKLQIEKSFQNLFHDYGITEETVQTFHESKKYWGTSYFKNDPKISPIVGALSMFGLTIDDIGASSCHGTSTKANDKNESNIINEIMKHLGRSKGNLLPIVSQKSITGHPKAAAGAWMINGALQMFHDSMIPGGVNYDNIDDYFKKFEYLVYPAESVKVSKLKAVSVSSFGFGQKGAFAVLINPNYILSSLNQADYEKYVQKATKRHRAAQRHYQSAILSNSLIKEKHESPYSDEVDTYLQPLIRADENNVIDNSVTNEYDLGTPDEYHLHEHLLQRWEDNKNGLEKASWLQKCLSEYFSAHVITVIPGPNEIYRMTINGEFVQDMLASCSVEGQKIVLSLYRV
ncbi:hypothetical protein ACO0QE_001171 [Hanseniaspora vineae]